MSLINIFFIFLIINALILMNCTKKNHVLSIPDIYILETDENLKRQNGYLLYEGSPFSGKLISLHIEKDTASLTPYWQGKEEGRAYQKYANGMLKEERFYNKGWKQGTHQGWWENGKRRFVANFKNDFYEGYLKEWYQSGQLFRDFNYKDGQEEGRQTAWWENGKVRQNYEIVNQRRYGLLGIKNCKSDVK